MAQNTPPSFFISIPETFIVPVRGINVLIAPTKQSFFNFAIAYRVASHTNVVQVETTSSTPFYSICQDCEYRKNFLNPYAPKQISCPGGYYAIDNFRRISRISEQPIFPLNNDTIFDSYNLTSVERGYTIARNAPICLKGSALNEDSVPDLKSKINYVATFPEYYFAVAVHGGRSDWGIADQYVLACPPEEQIKDGKDLENVIPFLSTNVYMSDGRVCNGTTTNNLEWSLDSGGTFDLSERLYRYLSMQRNNDLSEMWRDIITPKVTQHDIFKWISNGVKLPDKEECGPFAGKFLKGSELIKAVWYLKRYEQGTALWRSRSPDWVNINTLIGDRNYKSHFIPLLPGLRQIKVEYTSITLYVQNKDPFVIPTEYSTNAE